MKRLLVACALVLFVAVPAFAQETPIRSWIDFPSQSYVGPVSHLAGWALTCSTGQQPAFVFAYEMIDNQMVPLKVNVSWRVNRPDVRDAFANAPPPCGYVWSPYLGLHVTPQTPFAPGPHTVVLMYWDPTISWVVKIDQVSFTVIGGEE